MYTVHLFNISIDTFPIMILSQINMTMKNLI